MTNLNTVWSCSGPAASPLSGRSEHELAGKTGRIGRKWPISDIGGRDRHTRQPAI